ncbi:hypothetical protein C0J52_19879 [Blattella germanica]|nr:hypothetical protein C0J52_19879 [Blattella germanica]
MPDKSLIKRIYKWQPIGARPTGRPKNRWEDNVINDLRNMKIQNCNKQEIEIVYLIQAQRISWFGHINRMPDKSLIKRIYKWQPIAARPTGRP